MITLSKWSMAELDPISLAALIMTFGAAAIAVWLSFTGDWKCLATLKGDGWKWTVGTLIAILLGVWIFGERFNRLEGIGAIFVVLGVVGLRCVGGIEVERGFWIILAASVGFGIAEAIAKKTVTIVDPIAFSLARTVILGAAFTVVALVKDDGLILPSQSLGWLAIMAIAISGPFLGRVHFLKALQKKHISKISIVTQSQPIFVALLAFIILQTIPTQREWLGGAAILVGCAMLVLGRERPRRRGNGREVTPAS
jgi:drug/metabolite transporter (DMT)-like permease